MDRWQEFLPMSRASLQAIFKGAARNQAQFSPAERALFQACEFWTAVSTRSLAPHLGSDALDALRYMSIVYSGIGAHAVADEMIMAIAELSASSHPQSHKSSLQALQERLLNTVDPVDRLISHLARKLGLAGQGDANRTEPTELLLIRA